MDRSVIGTESSFNSSVNTKTKAEGKEDVNIKTRTQRRAGQKGRSFRILSSVH